MRTNVQLKPFDWEHICAPTGKQEDLHHRCDRSLQHLLRIRSAAFIIPLLVAVVFGFATALNAQTVTASSCSQTDVQNAINSVSSGETVIVPSQTCTWGSGITVTKAIHLHGAGIGNTVITGGIQYAPIVAEAAKVFELDGFTFQGASTQFQANAPNTSTPVTGIKVHDNRFTGCNVSSCRAVILPGLVAGVFYSNTFDNNTIAVSSLFASYWANVQWPSPLGGANYVYFEDNTFNNGAAGGWTSENGQSGRIAFRHNTITQTCSGCEVFDMHGEQGSGGWTISSEIYHNTITAGGNRTFYHRGGQAVIANNVIDRGALEFTEYYAWGGNGVCKPYPTAFDSSESYCSPINGTSCVEEQVHNTFYFHNVVGGSVVNPAWSMGTNICGGTPSSYIQQNREYWLPTSGLASALPASCTADGNTYYGATDTDVIYKCTATNTWSVFYQPYTYPHPLRGGSSASSPPAAPTNLTGVAQ
jgi:hypothetical protein